MGDKSVFVYTVYDYSKNLYSVYDLPFSSILRLRFAFFQRLKNHTPFTICDFQAYFVYDLIFREFLKTKKAP